MNIIFKHQLVFSVLLTFVGTGLNQAQAQNKVVVIPLMGSCPAPKEVPACNQNNLTNSIGMRFSLIPAGTFTMGSPPTEPHRNNQEGPQHQVTLTKSFYMQTTEVTQGQYSAVMGSNPSIDKNCGPNCPVENLTWNEAQAFITQLNADEGRSGCDASPNNCYSLPTEAQWEYAIRAGTVTAFYSGAYSGSLTVREPNLDKIGWYSLNSGGQIHPVAQKQPNNSCLYDMSGNVWEMTLDALRTYTSSPVTDPIGPDNTGSAIRGGNYRDTSSVARSANRNASGKTIKSGSKGFRLILNSG